MLIFSIGSITTPIFRACMSLFTSSLSIPDHPGASQEVVPSSLLSAPQNPQEPQQHGSKTYHAKPAQKSSPISNEAALGSHDPKSQQPFTDGFAPDAMKNNKIRCS